MINLGLDLFLSNYLEKVLVIFDNIVSNYITWTKVCLISPHHTSTNDNAVKWINRQFCLYKKGTRRKFPLSILCSIEN
jgi:hypothetical protein